LVIHITSTYFEASERTEGAPFKAIAHLFQKLGETLKRQKNLTHLVIHGNSTNGNVYNGLKSVFKCRTLTSLRVSGIPCFLQGKNIIPEWRQKLEELSLQDVLLNTDQAASNLWVLIGKSPNLVWLKMIRTRLASSALLIEKPRATLKQLTKLESLDMSNNDLGDQEATLFLRMVLASDHPRLDVLDLSGNPGIGNRGCESVIALLVNNNCWLKDLRMSGTGIDPRMTESVRTYLSRDKRIHPAV
jgi:hypothetical protein